MMIYLKPWTDADKERLMTIANEVNRSYLSDRLPYPYTAASADWYFNMVSKEDGKSGIFRAIWADHQLVGNISIELKSDVYRRDAEIGYMLDSRFAGKGVMTEAVRQMCALAFEQLDLLRITGLVYEPNLASRRILEKNGFVLEGIMKQAVTKADKTYNLCVYGKLK